MEETGTTTQENQTAEPTTTEGQTVTLTPDELKNQIQAEADRRVTQAVKTNSDKLMTDFTTERTELKERINKLEAATLTEKERDERAKAEKDNELSRVNQELLRYQFIERNDVENEFKSLLTAMTEEGLKSQLESIEAVIKKRVDDAMAKFRGSGEVGRPESGTGQADTFAMPKTHDELQKVYVQIKREKGQNAADEYYTRANAELKKLE